MLNFRELAFLIQAWFLSGEPHSSVLLRSMVSGVKDVDWIKSIKTPRIDSSCLEDSTIWSTSCTSSYTLYAEWYLKKYLIKDIDLEFFLSLLLFLKFVDKDLPQFTC